MRDENETEMRGRSRETKAEKREDREEREEREERKRRERERRETRAELYRRLARGSGGWRNEINE